MLVQRLSRQERPGPQDRYVRRGERLVDVAAHGMVRPSFVPPPPRRELRELTRYRKKQVDVRAAEIARLEKVLQDAGIKLTSVASKALTQSGRAMVEALIAGQRDPAALADLAKGKLRPNILQLTAELDGHFGGHHAIVAARILAHLDFLDATIEALDCQIAARVAERYPSAARLWLRFPRGPQERGGHHRRDRRGHEPVPSPAHLALWAGLGPGNHESAGKRRRAATTPGNPWLRRTLIESARAAARTKNSYFGAQYRQIAGCRGPNKAAVAVADSLLDVIRQLLTTGEVFTDLGATTPLPVRTPAIGPPPDQPVGELGYTVQLNAAA